MSSDIDGLKKQAAQRAVEQVESGMVVGLGHGSTAIHAVQRIAQLIGEEQLHDVVGVPCSRGVEAAARELGIPLTTLEKNPRIDLTIDGADEVSPQLDLIKGGGGALLREKVVAQASTREIIVVDESKLSPALGTKQSVPIEVVPFGWRAEADFLSALAGEFALRRVDDGSRFETDQGNYILDCNFGPIEDPRTLAAQLNERAGIVEHGMFLGLASEVIVAGPEGIRHLSADEG